MHQAKYKKKGKMAPESEIIEVVEKICGRATFDGLVLSRSVVTNYRDTLNTI